MRVKFELRSQKKDDSILLPLYVRVTEGRELNQAVKTHLVVSPSKWDQRAETIKSKVLISPEERTKIITEISELRNFLLASYAQDCLQEDFQPKGWLASTVQKFYSNRSSNANLPKLKQPSKLSFDQLFTEFLDERDLGAGRRKHYEVLRSMIKRYCAYLKYVNKRKREVHFDVTKVDLGVLQDMYDYIKNEYQYIEDYPQILEDFPETRAMSERGANYMNTVFKELRAFFNWCYKTQRISTFPFEGFQMPSERYGSPVYLTLEDVQKIASTDFSEKPELGRQRDIFVFQCNVGCRVGDLLRLKKQDVINGAVEYIPTKTIKEAAKTVVVPLNAVAQGIVDKYKDMPGEKLLPFISAQKYNDSIKEVLTYAGITYLVTELDTVTRKEKKTPINEIASSHMARRTFIGNIYKLVKDPNLVSALTGHVEGSRAFNRYRNIDIDMKKDLVKILENRK